LPGKLERLLLKTATVRCRECCSERPVNTSPVKQPPVRSPVTCCCLPSDRVPPSPRTLPVEHGLTVALDVLPPLMLPTLVDRGYRASIWYPPSTPLHVLCCIWLC